MKCPDCERLRSAYADATRQNVKIAELHRLAASVNDAAKRAELAEAALSADEAFREARLALAKHVAANHPEEDPSILRRNA
jgi:hypothetical protein